MKFKIILKGPILRPSKERGTLRTEAIASRIRLATAGRPKRAIKHIAVLHFRERRDLPSQLLCQTVYRFYVFISFFNYNK